MENLSLLNLNEEELHLVSDSQELESVMEHLPLSSSIEVEFKKIHQAILCEVRCFSVWGQLVVRRADENLKSALKQCCSSLEKSIPKMRTGFSPHHPVG